MNLSRVSRFGAAIALAAFVIPSGAVHASGAEEIRGSAILEHPCGQVAVKHMGLVSEGKMDEAMQLSTPEMQAEWSAMPEEDRLMLAEMLQAMSQMAGDFAADIEAHGVLVIEGDSGVLTLDKVIQDASGTSTMTMSQGYQIDGANCAIAP
ncbi:MAG TPA: hypothetical protein VK855_00025 [Thioalkalivibrio sp.]|nr:hypothetical protein [Thioalkalivibrio sp.]